MGEAIYMASGGGAEGGAAAPAPLPCQDTSNSNELRNSHSRKVAYALKENVAAMVSQHGLEQIGFLTLTFSDKVQNIREAQRRFNSLRTGVLSKRYPEWIAVVERQKSGRVHFHLLVVCAGDIRTGFDFEAVAKGDYRSASKILRVEWAFWRKTAPRYKFGRTELLPIKSTPGAISTYVAKYIGKHLDARLDADKGAKLVRYSRFASRVGTRFSWNSPGSWVWRHKCALLATLTKVGRDMNGAKSKWRSWFGKRWVYKIRPIMSALRLPSYPTGRHWNVDHLPLDHVHPEAVEVEPAFQFDTYAAVGRMFAALGAQTKFCRASGG